MSRRTERVEMQLRAELARVLVREVADPRIRMLTLTRVDVAPDLSSALVFWSTSDDADPRLLDEIAEGLESASGFLRSRLARCLSLRRIPELRFRYDPSLRLASETHSLIRSLEGDSKE